MSTEEKAPVPTGKEFEAASAALASKQALVAMGDVGQEAVTSATNETPEVTAAIHEQLAKPDHVKLIQTLKSVEHLLRKDYPYPERITVPVSRGTVIHQDFRRKVAPIPNHIAFPRPALVNGKAIQLGSVKVPAVTDEAGHVVAKAQELPIYVAAGPDGKPLRDSKGDFVVIDPQNGAIRQRVRGKGIAAKRNWWVVKWRLLVQWWRSLRFDFKIVKRAK